MILYISPSLSLYKSLNYGLSLKEERERLSQQSVTFMLQWAEQSAIKIHEKMEWCDYICWIRDVCLIKTRLLKRQGCSWPEFFVLTQTELKVIWNTFLKEKTIEKEKPRKKEKRRNKNAWIPEKTNSNSKKKKGILKNKVKVIEKITETKTMCVCVCVLLITSLFVCTTLFFHLLPRNWFRCCSWRISTDTLGAPPQINLAYSHSPGFVGSKYIPKWLFKIRPC